MRMLLEHRGKRPLHIVTVGLSRGGIGALMLATRLRKLIDQLETTGGLQGLEARIELSLLLFDPVPGNLIGVVKLLDPFKMSTAASVMDVSKAPITRVLSIYPYDATRARSFLRTPSSITQEAYTTRAPYRSTAS